MILSIMQMVLPVLVMFGIGYACNRFRVFGAQGLQGLKAVVGKVTLPVVLFNAFLTADYTGKIALTFVTVYIACGLGLLSGFLLRRFVKPYGKFLPFLTTNFEAGMLGYALFGLLYAGKTPVFAMVDIGQTMFGYTVYLAALKATSGEKTTVKSIAHNMFTNPAFIGMLSGVVLGLLGVGKWLGGTAAWPVVRDTVAFIAAPTSALILIIVGYELSFKRELMPPVLKTVAFRLVIMAALFALSTLTVFSIIPFDRELFVAFLLAYSLPAPFIIPLFADVTGHGEYISTALSVETLVSIALFIGIAAYSLA